MNKFEKYCWEKGIQDTLFGVGFMLNEDCIKLIKQIPFIWRLFKIKKQNRIQEFMGFYK